MTESESATIMIVEDDPDIANVLDNFCQQIGHRPASFKNGLDAIDAFRKERPDLIILDIMLPGASGLEVCSAIRMVDHLVPIIIISAKHDTADLVVALDRGADDYVVKPFKLRELEARISTQLRRGELVRRHGAYANPSEPLQFGELVMDLEGHSVSVGGDEVELSPLEYRLLGYFAQHAGKVITREELLKDVWGYSAGVETRTVDTHVGRLRKKIEIDVKNPKYIQSVPGFGYRFERRVRKPASELDASPEPGAPAS